MKTVPFLILFCVITVGSLRADFFSPFADAKVDVTVTSEGLIVAIERKGGGTDYFVRCRTCTGPENIPAEIPPALIHSVVTGRAAKITATIREREGEKAKAKTKTRFLEVTAIEFSK